MSAYEFGPFRLDVTSLQLLRGDEPVALTPKAFDTLLVLIEHRHRVVRKDELMHSVWPNSFVSEDSLTQNVTALRRALGDDSAHPEYITTIPRRGYRFVAHVTEMRHPEWEPSHAEGASEAGAHPTGAGTASRWAGSPAQGRATAAGQRLILVFGALLLLVVLALFGNEVLGSGDLQTTGHPLRLTIGAPEGTRVLSGVLSPDLRQIVLVAENETTGVSRLWVRSLDGEESRELGDTDGAAQPFWSPDGQSIAYFARGWLRRVGARGGPSQAIASTVGLSTAGGSWGPDGLIVFAHFKSGLQAVPATGGRTTEVTTLDRQAREEAHRWPQFLPGSRRFLYSISAPDPGRAGTYVGNLDSEERVRLIPEQGGTFVPPGYLVFVRDQTIVAQRFDPARMQLAGGAVPLAGGVPQRSPINGAVVSGAGELLAFNMTADRQAKLIWFDRSGMPLSEIHAPTDLYNPTLSSDGRLLLAGNGRDSWLVDLERDAITRVAPGNTPLLSPDGTRMAFTSGRIDGVADIFERSMTGTGSDELLFRSTETKFVNDWSRDGDYLVYASTNPDTRLDLWLLSTSGKTEPRPLLASAFNEFGGTISPDGRWLAYASDESGEWEVYVQAFPALGAKQVVSVGGGSEPQWRRDGRELFYLSANRKLMAVTITPANGGVRVSQPTKLFHVTIPSSDLHRRRNHYAVAADGQRFLVNVIEPPRESLTLLVNWTERVSE